MWIQSPEHREHPEEPGRVKVAPHLLDNLVEAVAIRNVERMELVEPQALLVSLDPTQNQAQKDADGENPLHF